MTKHLATPGSSFAALVLALAAAPLSVFWGPIRDVTSWTFVAVTDDATSAALGILSVGGGAAAILTALKVTPAITKSILEVGTALVEAITRAGTAYVEFKRSYRRMMIETSAKIDGLHGDMEVNRGRIESLQDEQNATNATAAEAKLRVVVADAKTASLARQMAAMTDQHDGIVKSVAELGEVILIKNGDLVDPAKKEVPK